MAIIHNLSDPSNNLSGLDLVDGISDGTTVGKSWLLWKLFEEFSSFDTTVRKITNSSPTPTFLQSYVGSNLQSEPALNRAVAGDSIRWYKTDDPGLSQTPANTVFYEWKIMHTGFPQFFTTRIYHLIDGGTLYNPTTDGTFHILSTTIGNSPIFINVYATTTVMADVPKIIFYKSNGLLVIMGINKTTGTDMSYALLFNPVFTGYKVGIGSTTEGVNHRGLLFILRSKLQGVFEAYAPVFNTNAGGGGATVAAGLDIMNSGGSMPSSLFSFNSENNLMAGKLRLGIKHDTIVKTISEEIEGVRLVNPSVATLPGIGAIAIFNGKYFLGLNTIHDGRQDHKMLLELEDV